MFAGMEGLEFVTNWPQMDMNAATKEGPWVEEAGPKYPLTSAPCWDGVLVAEGLFGVAGVGFCHPVGGTNEGGLGVNVVGALLLAGGYCGLIDGGRAGDAVGCKVDGGCRVCGIGTGVCDIC
jgi:hypothetical protein